MTKSLPQLPKEILRMISNEVALSKRKVGHHDSEALQTLFALRSTSKATNAAATPFVSSSTTVNINSLKYKKLLEAPLKRLIRRMHLRIDERFVKRLKVNRSGSRQPKQEVIHLCEVELEKVVYGLPILRELKISFLHIHIAPGDDSWTTAASKAKHLIFTSLLKRCSLDVLELRLSAQQMMSPGEQLDPTGPALTNLKQLRVGGVSTVDYIMQGVSLMSQFVGHMQSLKELNLYSLESAIATDILQTLGSSKLKRVTLDSCAMDGRAFCHLLARNQDTLTAVRLIECHLVNGTWDRVFMQLARRESLSQLWCAAMAYGQPSEYYSWRNDVGFAIDVRGRPYGMTGFGLEHAFVSSRLEDYHALGDLCRFAMTRPMDFDGDISKEDNISMSRCAHLLPYADVVWDPSLLDNRQDGKRYVRCELILSQRTIEVLQDFKDSNREVLDRLQEYMDWV